jgi:antitoxin PrlF
MIIQLTDPPKLYLDGMTSKVGAKGQVVIPKAIRDRVDLHPGDEVEVELRDDEIVLVARRHPAQLGGRFARSGMADRLLEDRAREAR